MFNQRVGSERIRPLGAGRFEVRSKTDPTVWYAVVDGICECKGYEFKQKCNHVEHLITHGLLSPMQVEGYHRNQRYPPVKLADPRKEHRFPVWMASYFNPIPYKQRDEFYLVGVPPVPSGMRDGRMDAYVQTLAPDDHLMRLSRNEPETFVQAYRSHLDSITPDGVAGVLATLKRSAGDKAVVLLSTGVDINGPTGFAIPRRVLATWFYEHTKQVIPEMWSADDE